MRGSLVVDSDYLVDTGLVVDNQAIPAAAADSTAAVIEKLGESHHDKATAVSVVASPAAAGTAGTVAGIAAQIADVPIHTRDNCTNAADLVHVRRSLRVQCVSAVEAVAEEFCAEDLASVDTPGATVPDSVDAAVRTRCTHCSCGVVRRCIAIDMVIEQFRYRSCCDPLERSSFL